MYSRRKLRSKRLKHKYNTKKRTITKTADANGGADNLGTSIAIIDANGGANNLDTGTSSVDADRKENNLGLDIGIKAIDGSIDNIWIGISTCTGTNTSTSIGKV